MNEVYLVYCWLAANSVGLLLLGIVIYLIARQLGVLLAHYGPVGAREMLQGPRRSENLSHIIKMLKLPESSQGKPLLLIFSSRACRICAHVRSAALPVASAWRDQVGIAVVYDEEDMVAQPEEANTLIIANSRSARKALAIASIPYAVVVDRNHFVIGHGLVNNSSHIESLLESMPTAGSTQA